MSKPDITAYDSTKYHQKLPDPYGQEHNPVTPLYCVIKS